MLILTLLCLGSCWVLILMTVSKANDADLVFYSVCITLPPICQGSSFYPASSLFTSSPVQQGRLRAGNCCGGMQEGRIMSAAAALTQMASYGKEVTSPGAVLFEKFPEMEKASTTPGSRSCVRMWPPVMRGTHGGRVFEKGGWSCALRFDLGIKLIQLGLSNPKIGSGGRHYHFCGHMMPQKSKLPTPKHAILRTQDHPRLYPLPWPLPYLR